MELKKHQIILWCWPSPSRNSHNTHRCRYTTKIKYPLTSEPKIPIIIGFLSSQQRIEETENYFKFKTMKKSFPNIKNFFSSTVIKNKSWKNNAQKTCSVKFRFSLSSSVKTPIIKPTSHRCSMQVPTGCEQKISKSSLYLGYLRLQNENYQ